MRSNPWNAFLKAAAFIAAFIIILNLPLVRDLPLIGSLQGAVSFFVWPVQKTAYVVSSGTGHLLSSVASLRAAQRENAALKEKLSQERSVAASFSSINDDNKGFRRLLGLKRSNLQYSAAVAAEIISRSPSSWFERVEIDKGTADGVYVNKAVINEDGLIGKVISAGKRSALVMLISDPACNISVSFRRTGDIGSASGLGVDKLKVRYVHSSSDIRVNDEVITSGNSSVFPKGIPVGRVKSIGKKDYDLFQQITIDASADLTGIEKVLVLR